MSPRYIFTITTGRSGQSSLTDLLNRSVPGCLAIFEGQSVYPTLPRFLGDLERRFRRRFVETHELLERGRVLPAFDAGALAQRIDGHLEGRAQHAKLLRQLPAHES